MADPGLAAGTAPAPERLLLCTDLDRTLLPNGRQPESPQARPLFARLVQRPEVTLAYVSGRDAGLVAEAIRDYALPTPDWVVADVGTTLLQVSPEGWISHRGWHQAIGRDWGGRTASDIQDLLADLDRLHLQEPSKQNTYKLSFYTELGSDVSSLQVEMQRRLNRQGFQASLIYSIDEPAQIGLLDVLPASATKLHAIQFLMQTLNFPMSQTLFAGDSGNDLPVMQSELPSVLVANADQTVIAQLDCKPGERHSEWNLYLARGGFMGMNGNYSAGILEGFLHFHPHLSTWLEAC
ncbi:MULTISPECIES: HAD-IIB family hydrolase [Aphanothece]|uniref:HAD-IIB family hydrolase n=1 Tax=Aphanothece TaxID=1121 RepID=UPI003984812B